jgi:KUP system potassium uptake protein
MLAGIVLLVLIFGSSSNLAAAYGIAVTGTMAIDKSRAQIWLRKATSSGPLSISRAQSWHVS